ncbi:hypothetical protein MP228_000863 [Amoeboaphelidium protococcarum]|nr:hypothetical protein MP228_000863 [Amoeboaphelidium protococcarum]
MLLFIFGLQQSGKRTVATWLKDQLQFDEIVNLIQSKPQRQPEVNDGAVGTSRESQLPVTILDTFLMRGGAWKKDIIVLLPRHVDSDLSQMLFQVLYRLERRPFFMKVLVDSCIDVRFKRHCSQRRTDSLSDFVQRDANAERSFKQSQLMYTADLVIQNDYESIQELHKSLARQFPNKLSLSTILRPQWDDYFMMLADLAAHRSNCMKRRVGCILVRNNRVIATGYNGTPRGVKNCNEGGCKRCNDGLSTDANSGNKQITSNRGFGLEECLCLHAEENALLEAGRDRIDISYHHMESSSHHGTILYCNTCPCLSCAKKIVQSGVREVVYRLEYAMDDQSRALLAEAGILLRQHSSNQMLICRSVSRCDTGGLR